MHLHGDSLADVKELASDKLVVQSESGELEVPLRALLPRADVHIEGDLMFGLVPVDSKASKTFRLVNKGTGPTEWRLDWDK